MRARFVGAVALAAVAVSALGASSGETARIAFDEPVVPVTIRIAREQADAPRESPGPGSPLRTPARSQSIGGAPRPSATGQFTPALRSGAAEPPAAVNAPGVIRVWHVMYATTRPDAPKSNASSSPCPLASTCDSNQVRQGRWPTDDAGRATIPFAYNDEGRRPARAADGIARPSLAAAMGEWSRWNSNVVFRDEGTTDAAFGADGPDGTCADGTNVVTWRKFSPEVIGAAVICFDRSGKVIRDADLALNATQHWERMATEAESRHSHDIQAIYTHELGHWLSLEDLYTKESTRQTMHGGTQYEEFHKRTLARGDVVGVQKAYPCAAGDGCPSSGIKDD